MWPFKRKKPESEDPNNILLSVPEIKKLIQEKGLRRALTINSLEIYSVGFTLSGGNLRPEEGIDATINGIHYKLDTHNKPMIVAIPPGSEILYYAYK